jgi:uncharacterized protein
VKPFAAMGRALVWAYRYTLSPFFYTLGVRCRHEPTCSAYADDALKRYGLWVGGWMTLARLVRCRPGGSHGFDPVPDVKMDWAAWRVADWKGPRNPGI